MSDTSASFIVQIGRTPAVTAATVTVTDVATAEQVPISEAALLVRVLGDDVSRVTRCLVRHLLSGEEVYVQLGPTLQAFLLAWLSAGGGGGGS